MIYIALTSIINIHMMTQPTFEEVFTPSHLMEAAHKCCNNVRWKRSTQLFELNQSIEIAKLYKELMNGTYISKGFNKFSIIERGKKRNIQAVHITERVVQKCLCTYFLRPLLEPKLIIANAASLPGKGTDYSINRLKKDLISHYRKYGREGGILLLDYKDFFNSIPHIKILNMLKYMIEDEKIFDLTSNFVTAFKGEKGLGLGSEVSQMLAIYYPNIIDHYIKEHLYIKGYGRYMDDSYLIHQDLNYLKYCYKKIYNLNQDLQLSMHKCKIVKFNQYFTFLKKKFFITKTGKIIINIKRQNITHHRNKLKKLYKKRVNPIHSHQAWKGYALNYNSYNTVQKMDLLYNNLFTEEGKND